MSSFADLRVAYRLRWKRRELLYRAHRLRHQLSSHVDRTDLIAPGMILAFSTVRNEYERLPHFLSYYRALGVQHFLFVANACTDEGVGFLADQPDVSLWTTGDSYKASRFGMDWVMWLLSRYGQGQWCLTVDADELLVYPNWESEPLPALTKSLDDEGRIAFGAVMVDLYPKGPVGDGTFRPGDDPLDLLQWFDNDGYRRTPQPHLHNDLIQGGVRDRMYFGHASRRAPTMNKTPLMKWHWRYAYMNSTHTALPPRLNAVFSQQGVNRRSGALLHTKFLPSIVAKSREEKQRKQHFARSEAHDDYYDALTANPVFWTEASLRYTGWRQLAEMGLISLG